MNCKCGYSFAQHSLEGLRKKVREFESYAAINDRDYRRFMKLEMKVWTCEDKDERLTATLKSSRWVGSVYECPQCSRLLFLKPRTNELVFYLKEE